MPETNPRPWHHYFGLLLGDVFLDSPYDVVVEEDLAKRKQILDVLVVRRRAGRLRFTLPDGFDSLAPHNLITFKSLAEPLDDWALKELTGHYVNYRKQLTPRGQPLLPESDFRLYAVCVRYPHNLAAEVPLVKVSDGVYDCRRGTDTFRIIVVGELSLTPQNAALCLLAATPEAVQFGARTYEPRGEVNAVLGQLFQGYQKEGITMSYTYEELKKKVRREYLREMPPDERRELHREFLASLPPQERLEMLASLPPQKRLKMLASLPAEERLKMLASLPAEERREMLASLPAEERREMLASLPAEERRAMLATLPAEERRAMLATLPAEERRAMLASLPLEERLAGASPEEIQQLLEKLRSGAKPGKGKATRKK